MDRHPALCQNALCQNAARGARRLVQRKVWPDATPIMRGWAGDWAAVALNHHCGGSRWVRLQTEWEDQLALLEDTLRGRRVGTATGPRAHSVPCRKGAFSEVGAPPSVPATQNSLAVWPRWAPRPHLPPPAFAVCARALPHAVRRGMGRGVHACGGRLGAWLGGVRVVCAARAWPRDALCVFRVRGKRTMSVFHSVLSAAVKCVRASQGVGSRKRRVSDVCVWPCGVGQFVCHVVPHV
mmetsp:Transcript_39495/g.103589  ORF Transcript_39495/g.103589 Transcript_39495/m.103589 type:complete len:238 (+) Transcript_39495:1612-2325(+)